MAPIAFAVTRCSAIKSALMPGARSSGACDYRTRANCGLPTPSPSFAPRLASIRVINEGNTERYQHRKKKQWGRGENKKKKKKGRNGSGGRTERPKIVATRVGTRPAAAREEGGQRERGREREIEQGKKKGRITDTFRPLPMASPWQTRNLYEWPRPDQC